MLAEGIAFVALRHRSLYHAQVATKRESPAHRGALIFDVLKAVLVGDVVVKGRAYATFVRKTPAKEVFQAVANATWQHAFPVLAPDGQLVGAISEEILRTMSADPELRTFALADDMMNPPVSVKESDDLHTALELLLAHEARELVVVDDDGKIVGFLSEAEITRAYHGQTQAEAAT